MNSTDLMNHRITSSLLSANFVTGTHSKKYVVLHDPVHTFVYLET